ncbi:hypothetical protein [Paraglaciecola sp. L3A3]|uniref:hypothetical protein n=1 Tax=Paraglaciecola sp. L3A3 TaxID=2686358 RepID=UPI00131D5018|nr:hypothetical protein [Paraglaciecola sp. L3A3]
MAESLKTYYGMEVPIKIAYMIQTVYGIRAFIQKYLEQSLVQFTEWAKDANYHVRRLVSEGTCTRLP